MKRPLCLTRKRSFLLIELIISLFLITLCLFPLFKPFLNMQRFEMQKRKEIAAFREDRERFCKAKEDLFEHKYSWKELQKGISCEDYMLIPQEITKRDSLGKQGILLRVKTNSEHMLFVEKMA